MAWTDERVELLKKLWAEGLSASQIAGRLGGVTRNAVIGKVHRLGLSGRAFVAREYDRARLAERMLDVLSSTAGSPSPSMKRMPASSRPSTGSGMARAPVARISTSTTIHGRQARNTMCTGRPDTALPT